MDPHYGPSRSPYYNTGLAPFWRQFYQQVIDLVSFQQTVDRPGAIAYIQEHNDVTGPNAWMLVCSIFLASIGLDLNSPAVIIGGMLVSPLMSPILGMGLGVSIRDRRLLMGGTKQLVFAVLIAVLTSGVYFALTPFGQVTPEILARTHPTLLDAAIAFFGGVAGIISISRQEKGTAIPGVAIATALMPPLCVTGYGLAKLDLTIVLNSFYLFFLNTGLIILATFLISRYLRFPFKQYTEMAEALRSRRWVLGIVLVLLFPSTLILHSSWKQVRVETEIQDYLTQHVTDDPWCLEWHLEGAKERPRLILELVVRGASVQELDKLEHDLRETFPQVEPVLLIQREHQGDEPTEPE